MSEVEPVRQPRPPSLADSLIAVGVLIALVAASFLLFGENAAYGPTQVALILAATLAAGLAWKNGHAWVDIRKAVVDGIRDGDFVNSVREDPVRRGLLYAATELGMYVSFDDGDHWQPLQMNLPRTSVRDIDVHGDDLVTDMPAPAISRGPCDWP